MHTFSGELDLKNKENMYSIYYSHSDIHQSFPVNKNNIQSMIHLGAAAVLCVLKEEKTL